MWEAHGGVLPQSPKLGTNPTTLSWWTDKTWNTQIMNPAKQRKEQTTATCNTEGPPPHHMKEKKADTKDYLFLFHVYETSRKGKTKERGSWPVAAGNGAGVRLGVGLKGQSDGVTENSKTASWWWLHNCVHVNKNNQTVRFESVNFRAGKIILNREA